MFTELESIRDKLAAVPGVVSCEIGIEPDITADKYPIIRLVPVRFARSKQNRIVMYVEAYFGIKRQGYEGDRLPELYQKLFEMDTAIRKALGTAGDGFRVHWDETITDDDRLPLFKLFKMTIAVEIIKRHDLDSL